MINLSSTRGATALSKGRRRLRRLGGLAAATAALGLVTLAGPGVAHADTSEGGTWDAPPTCFRGEPQAHRNVEDNGNVQAGIYQYLSEYSYRIYYGNGYETRYVWVYEVQSATGGVWQMTTVGFAHKLCGAEWTQTSSNFA